ncbi:hypothetical protein EK21DRAFT_79834, partial [Setomelanomma holmii]
CTSCGSFSARYCSGCRSAACCSIECQQTDWRTYRRLRRAIKDLSAPTFPSRSTPSSYLAIYFPMVNPLAHGNPQQTYQQASQVRGHFEPDLDELLHVAGQEGYIGRRIQIVRGNILRGRPKFRDSLNIRYLDDFDTDKLPVNETLHGGPSAVCADGWGVEFWTGPIVAYLKAGNDLDAKNMTDMTLTAYRDALDYLAYFRETVGSAIDFPGSEDHRSKVIMAERSGKVKGVRVNCAGHTAGDPAREFLSVEVPRAHPLFMLQGDDPLEVSEALGESWAAYRYAGHRDPTAEEARKPNARLLLVSALGEDDVEWRGPLRTGSLLLVDRTKHNLGVRKVQRLVGCFANE